MWSCATTDTAHVQRSYLATRNSHSLNGDPPVKVNKVFYGKDYALRAVLYLMSYKCDVRVVSCNINKKIKILRVAN